MNRSTVSPDNPAALRYLLALLSGGMLALSFPNPGITPLAWIAFVPLLMAAADTTPREALKLGFAAGVAAYAGILYWLNIVLVGYGHLHWTVSGTIYLLGVGYVSLYPAAVMWLTRRAERSGIQAVLAFPVLWVAAELIRSYIPILGFPWASLGYSQYRTLPLIQISDLTGVYGVSFLIAFANVVFYRMWTWTRQLDAPYPVRSFAALLVLMIATLCYGFASLKTVERGAVQRVLLVQGNIPQDVKWNPAFQEKTVATYERLSRQACQTGGTLVVWPESALPFYLQGDGRYSARVKSLALELKSCLVTGSPAVEREQGVTRFLNSAFMISPEGDVVGRSDKMHLVPFGEYVPLAPLLPFVNKLVAGIGDYSPGKQVVPLDTPQGKVGVLICFEGIFPEVARAYVREGAGVLVNITNDAWFGNSSAPYQHLSMTVFRAVENRVPLVRAANTGISSVIDSKGHIRAMTPLFEEATLAAEVRRGQGGSFYSRYGDLFALACLVGTIFIASMTFRREASSEAAPEIGPTAL